MDVLSDAEITAALNAKPATYSDPVGHANAADTASLKPDVSRLSSSMLAAERRLEAYDMDSRWGPSLGISRTQRYERALRLNLNPPQDIGALLSSHPTLNVNFPVQL